MRRGRLMNGVLAAALFLFAATAPAALGQGILNEAWFKVSVNMNKCFVVPAATPEAGTATKATYQTTLYLQLTGGPNSYSGSFWTQVTPGNWQPVGGGMGFTAYGSDESAIYGGGFGLTEGAGQVDFSGLITGTIKIRRSSAGTLRSATFKILPVVLGGTTNGGGNLFFGTGKLTMKSMDPARLPFPPP